MLPSYQAPSAPLSSRQHQAKSASGRQAQSRRRSGAGRLPYISIVGRSASSSGSTWSDGRPTIDLSVHTCVSAKHFIRPSQECASNLPQRDAELQHHVIGHHHTSCNMPACDACLDSTLRLARMSDGKLYATIIPVDLHRYYHTKRRSAHPISLVGSAHGLASSVLKYVLSNSSGSPKALVAQLHANLHVPSILEHSCIICSQLKGFACATRKTGCSPSADTVQVKVCLSCNHCCTRQAQ